MSSTTTMCSMRTRSSLEIMLDVIQQRDEQGSKDVPPALPARPASRARLPPARRSLPINLQKGGLSFDFKESQGKKKEDVKSGFQLGVFESTRTDRKALVESPYKPMSSETEASTEECECGDCVGVVLKKVGVLEDTRERALQGILGIQKCFRGHQARCYYRELRRGIYTLQSFVRGENARKDYKLVMKRLTAIVVLQNQMKRRIARRTFQKRQKAVLRLQSAIRGWLTRKHLRCIENLPCIEIKEATKKLDRKNPETKDHVQVLPSVLADLQRRLLRADAALLEKEEEKAALQQQLLQFENKWSLYEAKMKSMEEMWQDQLTSFQISLAAAKKSLAVENTTAQPGKVVASPEYLHFDDRNAMVKFSNASHDAGPQRMKCGSDAIGHLNEQQKMVINDDANFLLELKSGQLASSMNPDIELQKLKLRFGSWKKDYKIRLQETKVALHKLGHSEAEKNQKKWWGNLKHTHKRNMGC
ncbi:myosin-1-like [Cornus florida]|uniref:myosin-1-like n=1 Tax=Cornus florida TaxID=4283 RepID=UPI0028A283D7|nr:myosin-1-like [Cornus florida]